ncbi:MAG: agglutinin biogenesis protein MshI [Pseudomonadota bacterium]|nr:agglutinin biogenesis protein MshI [Pseudomonadota bacterium]
MIRSLLQKVMPHRAEPGWLAVDIGERSVSVAHVRPIAGRPVLEFAEERAWDSADPRSLEKVAREFDAAHFRCITLLRPPEYQMLLVEAPAVKREELKPAIRWRIKDMIDYSVDEATLDMLDLPLPAGAEQRPHQMYAIAARNETIRTTIERFAKAGMPLAVIDIPDTAQRNMVALFERERRGVMALSFDDYGGLVTVNFSGELYLSRRLDLTGTQLIESAGEERARLLDRVLVETQRSLDHCERSFPFFSLGRVLLGSLPEEVGLAAHLAANLYLPVDTLDMAQVMRLPGSTAAWEAEDRAHWMKLIGAGLRIEKKTI